MAETTRNPVQKYLDVISAYDATFKKWNARTEKILKRYRDDNRNDAGGNETARFNILWSNVQTLIPAVYSKMPKADVSRRFVDNDPVGRVAALIVERCLDYEIEHYPDFRSAMHNCVTDRFLGGRGVSWVRYEPHIAAQEVQVTEDVQPSPDQKTEGGDSQGPQEEVKFECSPTDYVYWRDFGHNPARTWEEVTCVWRWVFMTKPQLVARFGKKKASKIPLDTGPERLDKNVRGEKYNDDRAKICELWDREEGCAYWFSKANPDFLDERTDPLGLEGFFPCAKPLYATTTTDSLVPVADFALYQDQANELDILSDRIDGLVKALRVRGIYDASIPELQRLLTEGDNNTLIGTPKWQQFSEKGGLKGAIDLLPINDIANALMQAYQARADIKSQVYEITGISDIVRGQGAASETATAQQIKGQYAGLRLRSMQETVAIFATDLLRIKAQIICSKYQDATILGYAATRQFSDEDQALVPQAMELLRHDHLASFRIGVGADSLVELDQKQTQQERMMFLQAVGQFLQQAVPAGQQAPELLPALVGMIKFGVAGFKAGRQLEGSLDAALQKLVQRAAQEQANPKPDPEAQKAQAKAQADAQAAQMQAQVDMQTEKVKGQATAQMEQVRMFAQMQLQQQQQRHDAQMEAMTGQLEQMRLRQEQAYDMWEARLKAATQLEVAEISAKTAITTADMAADAAADKTLQKDLAQ